MHESLIQVISPLSSVDSDKTCCLSISTENQYAIDNVIIIKLNPDIWHSGIMSIPPAVTGSGLSHQLTPSSPPELTH